MPRHFRRRAACGGLPRTLYAFSIAHGVTRMPLMSPPRLVYAARAEDADFHYAC